MNDNTPCVVYYTREDLPGDYTKVMRKEEAIEIAQELAAQGCETRVFKLTEFLYYRGVK